jgi:hypothetical protein
MEGWKPEYGLALVPVVGAIAISLLIVIAGGSPDAAQWAAVIFFFISLPFVVGRLMDRAR